MIHSISLFKVLLEEKNEEVYFVYSELGFRGSVKPQPGLRFYTFISGYSGTSLFEATRMDLPPFCFSKAWGS